MGKDCGLMEDCEEPVIAFESTEPCCKHYNTAQITKLTSLVSQVHVEFRTILAAAKKFKRRH